MSVSLTSGNSKAPFTPSTISKLRDAFQYRCAICMIWIQTSQCAHIIDAASVGLQQLQKAVELGVLTESYNRNAVKDGHVRCPNCHSLFTANYIVLSLPLPLLRYLADYVRYTPSPDRKPLHKVFELLVDAVENDTPIPLPGYQAVLPYLGLYTVVSLKPTLLTERSVIHTSHLPPLWTLRNHRFIRALSSTPAELNNPDAARIFNSQIVEDDAPFNCGFIPLSPERDNFSERRYWRLPIPPGAVLAALFARLELDSSKCEDIQVANIIHSTLKLQLLNAYQEPLAGPSGGHNGGPGDGGGPCAGGGGRQGNGGGSPSAGSKVSPKRKGPRDGKNSSPKGSQKKGRSAAGRPHCDANDFSFQMQSKHRPSHCDSDASCRFSTFDQDSSWDGLDSEDGQSASAINPHMADNPDEWQFGPSFSTNKIVFTARAVILT